MKFTIVIPTRERMDTLEWSIKTCLCQDYEDFEVLVSDNASQDGTADLVKSFSDPRIRYINTGKRLGMSQNWEFALSHVEASYVFFMGDDDGLLPDALQKANQLLTEYQVDALTWKKASYSWPNCINSNAQNCLVISLRRGVELRNSEQMLRRVCDFDPTLRGTSYEQLPGLYNSFVAISAIDKARSQTGKFFCSQIPDVYSAIALTSSVKTYAYSDRPLSINGASSHSNGTSYMKSPKGATSAKFLSEDNIPFHPDILLAPSIPVILTESVWQVRDNIQNCEDYDVNLEKFIAEAHRLSATRTKEGREMVDAALDRACEARGYDRRSATNDANNSTSRKIRRLRHTAVKRFENYIFSYLKQFQISEVSNVYEASLFCQKTAKRNRAFMLAGSVINRISKRWKSRTVLAKLDRDVQDKTALY